MTRTSILTLSFDDAFGRLSCPLFWRTLRTALDSQTFSNLGRLELENSNGQAFVIKKLNNNGLLQAAVLHAKQKGSNSVQYQRRSQARPYQIADLTLFACFVKPLTVLACIAPAHLGSASRQPATVLFVYSHYSGTT